MFPIADVHDTYVFFTNVGYFNLDPIVSTHTPEICWL